MKTKMYAAAFVAFGLLIGSKANADFTCTASQIQIEYQPGGDTAYLLCGSTNATNASFTAPTPQGGSPNYSRFNAIMATIMFAKANSLGLSVQTAVGGQTLIGIQTTN